MKIKLLAMCLLLSGFMLLAACSATGPKLSSLDPETLVVNEDVAQFIFYRVGYFGNAIKPLIYVDETPTGKCETGGVFIVNVNEGDYIIKTTTEKEDSLSFKIFKNEKIYINCEMAWGLIVARPKLVRVTNLTGEKATKNLSFTGKFNLNKD
jgi:hypothetical protein